MLLNIPQCRGDYSLNLYRSLNEGSCGLESVHPTEWPGLILPGLSCQGYPSLSGVCCEGDSGQKDTLFHWVHEAGIPPPIP